MIFRNNLFRVIINGIENILSIHHAININILNMIMQDGINSSHGLYGIPNRINSPNSDLDISLNPTSTIIANMLIDIGNIIVMKI